MMEKGKLHEKWLYIGKVETKKNEIAHKFERLSDDLELTNDTYVYGLKKKTFAPGGVYNVCPERKHDQCLIVADEISFNSMFSNAEKVGILRASYLAFETLIKSQKLEKKYKNGVELPDDWITLKKTYDSLPYNERPIFESLLIAKLRKTKTK